MNSQSLFVPYRNCAHYRLMYALKYAFPLLFVGTLLSFQCQPKADSQVSLEEAEKIFAYEVYPMLESKCFACHGEDTEELKGEFDIRSLEGMLEGGESGNPALFPGHPEQSPMFVFATRADEDVAMPPKENDKLTEEQLRWLKRWIQGKAPWPDEDRRRELLAAEDWDYGGTIAVETSTARSQIWARRRYKAEDLWAFSPISTPQVPHAFLTKGQTNPIDAFINQKLEEADLSPARRADKHTLIRRLTFDLTGLPPTPEEVADFVNDNSPNAYEKVLERLLSSPHYGEQWARHWLDVVRYADTDGFSNDYARPNAWRYRDYVIRSFNDDKPYDQFLREQLAGDEMDPTKPEYLIATGFLRMGPWEHTGMSVAAETRQYYLDDVTNGVGETMLSLPLRCARCHDHKFDPIPTKDYYQIQAVFATTQFADREAPFMPEENLNRLDEEKAWIVKWLKEAEEGKAKINEKEENAAKKWYAERGKRYLPKRQRRKLPEDQQPPRYLGLSFDDLGARKMWDKQMQMLRHEMRRFEPLAFSVYNGPNRVIHSARPFTFPETIEGDPDSTFILTGGSVYAEDEWVMPGILSAVTTLDTLQHTHDQVHIPGTMEKRRLKFSHWVTHPQNPLTTRSIVNRIWQYHFGKGLAENSNNFGATGKKPTHPELLDWLATWFVENGWSIKKLHQLITTSEAYQRSSHSPNPQRLSTRDPDNLWLSVFTRRRLEAEEIRDAMLLTSGELNPETGGIPIRPEINMEVALQPRHTMGSIARAYEPSPEPEDRNRRTIYAQKYRNMPDPMLEVFNQPGPDLSCERRTTSAITPQVFTLLNSQNSQDRSIAFAHRMKNVASSLEEQIAFGLRWAWNREASEEEIGKAKMFVEKMIAHHKDNPPVKQTYPVEVKRRMFEEMTGEPFEYTERLDIYANYTPDLKAWEVDVQTRALADLALVLFNSNEFIYVY